MYSSCLNDYTSLKTNTCVFAGSLPLLLLCLKCDSCVPAALITSWCSVLSLLLLKLNLMIHSLLHVTSLSLCFICLDMQSNAVQGHFIAQWDYHRQHQHFCTLCSPVPFETSSFYGRRWTNLSRLKLPFVCWKSTEQFETWASLIYSDTKTYRKKHYNLISVFFG